MKLLELIIPSKLTKPFYDSENKSPSHKLPEIIKKGDYYSNNRKIITENNNEINLDINTNNHKIKFSCYYEKNYFTTTFSNSFNLKEIKRQYPYFGFCNSVEEVFNEIKGNKSKRKIYIRGNENNSDKIILVIPIPSAKIKEIRIELKKKIKNEKEILKEYIYATKRHEYEDLIENLNSGILLNNTTKNKDIKKWISPYKRLKANLLYQFHIHSDYDENDEKIIINEGENASVSEFHNKCDNKSKILILCKSNNEIFGGYTPLCFNSNNKNENDNKSFLFSLNGDSDSEKYIKTNKNTESIKCNKNLGPCFSKDLFFIENKMNIVKFSRNNYHTKDNWINLDKCKKESNGILLDDLEIFQIQEENYNFSQLKTDIYNNIDFDFNNIDNNDLNNNDNNIDNINNDNNIINDIDNNSISISDYNNNNQINIDNSSNNDIIDTISDKSINSEEIIINKEKINSKNNQKKKNSKNNTHNFPKDVKIQEKEDKHKENQNQDKKEYNKVLYNESKNNNNSEQLFSEEEQKIKENRGIMGLKKKLNLSNYTYEENEKEININDNNIDNISNSDNSHNIDNVDNDKF